MTSSMLTGDRSRWASARRGGMVSLGKIAVPKPLNLPSQRLENHGLDPNVEIVPKGTLSWGSRSSSSASNAWGSSALSPNADGGTGSPSRLSGRPSSGGSGTRPSTAGSDRAHEPTANAWGPNSRPSSASGALTSNQTSMMPLRPRSAETRPGSSQLSRFAESLSENSVAWGAAGTAEKLGVASSKNDGFSLSSGDFPTLGSEKDNPGKNTESQDHGSHSRPRSSSGGVALVKDRIGTSTVGDVSSNANSKSGTVNTWRRDSSPYVEDGIRPSVEKWQGDPQPYLNASIPPQHFDHWHGNPVSNSPGGVWYRGPPGGPPYGTPVAPGGFPMEPFPYYRPQIPVTALSNSQPVPPPGAGPRGHHPKNGDFFRPHMPDAYIRPGMPIRPGFYAGPVAYDGYYGPPLGFCNPNERDIPFMGMAAGPSVYNRYPSQNAPDPSNSHARSGEYGNTGKAPVLEEVESGHPPDSRGQYKVLLKQHNGWDGKDAEEKWEHTTTTNVSYLEKRDQPRALSWENDWGADHGKDEEMDSRRKALGEEPSPQTSDNRGGGSSVSGKVKFSKSAGNAKAVDDSSVKKLEAAASPFPEVPQLFPATPKDPTLIQKIEGLNAKARASDGRHDVSSASSREEQKTRSQVVNAKAKHSTNEAGTGAVYLESTHTRGISIPASHEVEKSLEPTIVARGTSSRGATHGVQSGVDQRGKEGVSTQELDGWRKKSLAAENFETSSNVRVQDRRTSVEAFEKSESILPRVDEGESATPMFDPSDNQAQRAKMKQRAEQLQKEEEERIREQKAKALAKLEELNKRTKATKGSTQKLENVPPSGAMQHKQEESRTVAEPTMEAIKCEAPSSALVSNPNLVSQISESSTNRVGESTVLSRDLLLEKPKNAHQVGESTVFSRDLLLEKSKNAHQESVVPHNQSLPSQEDVCSADAADCKTASQSHDNSVVKQKRMGYKQKQNIPSEKKSTEKSISTSATEAPKSQTDVAVNVNASADLVANEIASSCESSLPINSNVMAESSVHQREKNYRSGKNKHKLEEASSVAALPSPVPKETNLAKASVESGKPRTSDSQSDPSSVKSLTDSKDAIQSSEQNSAFPSEEAHGRVNNQWKFLHSRRMPRNPQANRSAEKFHSSDAVVWAPVRSQNKMEVTDEASHKAVSEAATPSAKGDYLMQNSPKSKRAEMERYVPKRVAEELAQQGSIQQPMSPKIDQTTSDETIERAESISQSTESTQPSSSAVGKIGLPVESRNGDSKPNKQVRAHGSWRQRVSTESTRVQGLQDESSFTSNTSINVQQSVEHQQPLKPDEHLVKGQPKNSEEWNTNDGWNTPDNFDSTASVTFPVVKDQGVMGRGKRHSFKGQKGMGNNNDLDHKNINSGDTEKIHTQSSALEMSQTDRTNALKENRGTSHWQPKSQAYSAHNHRGSRANGGQNVAEVGRAIKKESAPHGGVHVPPHHDKEISEGMTQPHHDQSISENSNSAEVPDVGHQEAKRERRLASLKGRSHSPNPGLVSMDESAPPATMDIRHEQRSGFRKNGNQNSRFGRGHESRGDWSSAGQDNKQQNLPANRERQRYNSHYEYQPIGPYSNNKLNNLEGPTDGSHMGSRFRERGQSHPRRGGGNFYARQSGSVRVDASYN